MDEDGENHNELVPIEDGDDENPIAAGGAIGGEEQEESESPTEDEEAEEDDEVKRRRMMGVGGSRPGRDGQHEETDGAAEAGGSQNGGKSERTVTFNRSLPAVHAYLGRDLEEVGIGGQRVFDDNAIVDNIPLFPVPNLILMPGQTLPLQSLHPRAISMFRAIIARSQMFGVVNVNYNVRDANLVEALSNLGTLTQVLACKEATSHEVTTLKLRAVGRERFEILETRREIDGTVVGKVKIFPEIVLGSCLAAAELPCTQAMQAVGSRLCLRKFAHSKRDSKYFASAFTPWPWFVYRQYDIVDVIRQIKQELKEWYDPQRVEQLSELPVEFSYWVASNLPLDNETKLRLLGINCALQRLRLELSLIKKFTILICRGCSAKIGDKANLFSMSFDGIISAFVNPHGYVHETITLTEATSITEAGYATTENSWFPGYAWTIANCAQCSDHLGWKFSARRRRLKPETFYGISRAAVLPSRDESAAPAPSEEDGERLPCM